MTKEEKPHSELGGSTANRILNCQGSVILSRGLPPQIASESATEGSEAHKVLEIVLEDFLRHKTDGTDPDIRAHLLTDNEEMLEHAYAFRDRIWKDVLGESITSKAYGVEETFVFEKSLDSFGTLDFWCIYINDRAKRVGVIVDYKYGTFPVEAEDNDQLRFYACALLNEIRLGGKDLDIVKTVIFQPRSRFSDESYDPYKEVQYTVKQLDAWRKKFLKAAHSIFVEKRAKFKTGKWCYFCPAQSKCELYAKELSKSSALALLDIETETLPEPSKVSDDVISKILLNEERILDFVKACKKYAMNKALSSGFPGFKVVNGPSRRQWRKDVDVAGKLLEVLNVSPSQIFNQKIKGIGDVEKLFKSLKQPNGIDYMNETLVTKSVPPLLLVEQNDPRSAITGAADLLSVIEEED